METSESKTAKRHKVQKTTAHRQIYSGFFCYEKKIIIELDGGQHAMLSEKQKDIERDKWFETQGYKVLRFWDDEVLMNTRGVLEVIRIHCFNHPPLHPLPSMEGTSTGKSEELKL